MKTKKKFVKPEMEVYELGKSPLILCASQGGQTDPWNQE